MDIKSPKEGTEALQNFQRQLSSIAMQTNITPDQFNNMWELLQHLPPMKPYLKGTFEIRLSAAIHFFGDLQEFGVEPDYLYDYNVKSETNIKNHPERFFIGFTDDMPPSHPLVVDGYLEHEGDTRKAIETALNMLLKDVGCWNCNDMEMTYDDEANEDIEMPDMPDFKVNMAAFNRCKKQQDELGDWLRNVELLAKHFAFDDIISHAEETIDTEQLYPMVYKHVAEGYNQIDSYRNSGCAYIPLGQYYLVDKNELISDMPPINPEKLLNKIFAFNLENLAYGIWTS